MERLSRNHQRLMSSRTAQVVVNEFHGTEIFVKNEVHDDFHEIKNEPLENESACTKGVEENVNLDGNVAIPEIRKKGGPPRKYATTAEYHKAQMERARQKKAAMTPEEREEFLRGRREHHKKYMESLTEEKKLKLQRQRIEARKRHWEKGTEESRRIRNHERNRRNLEKMTEEQREAYKEKKREYYRKRKLEMTGEEKQMFEPENAECKLKRPEVGIRPNKLRKYHTKEEWRKGRKENERRRRAAMTPEQREEFLKKTRERTYMYRQAKLARMTKEEREEFSKKQHEMNKRKYRQTKKTEEQKEKERQQQYFRVQAKLAQMTPEERKEYTRKNTEAARKWRENLTGEKKERYMEYVKEKAKKYQKTKFKSSGAYDRVLEYLRRKTATETPEERQKRLRRYKVNQAVRKLKKELENEGVPPEEIEAKAMELKERMWAEPLPPPEKISTYAPRPRLRKPKRTTASRDVSESSCLQVSRRNATQPEEPKTNEGGNMEVLTSENAVPNNHFASENESDDNNEGLNNDYEDNYVEPITSHPPSPAILLPSDQEIGTSDELSPPSSSSINCPHCTSQFPQKCDLMTHVTSEHPKKCWKCPLCKMILLSPTELKEHFRSDHAPEISGKTSLPEKELRNESDKVFNCIKCDLMKPSSEKALRSLKDLNEHVKSKHPESYWPCSKCNLLKYSERSLAIHEKVCRGIKNKIRG